MVAALHRLCCVMGLLRSLLPLLTLTQQQQQQQGNQDDECLSRSLAALGQWLGRLGADLGAAAEAEPLLRALLDDSARLLDGGHGALWPLSSVALTSLLAAAAPLGLGPPSGQGYSPLTAAEVDALRAEMDSLRVSQRNRSQFYFSWIHIHIHTYIQPELTLNS